MTESNLKFMPQEDIRVLLVEDNREHANLISMILEYSKTQNFSITQASRMREALDLLKSEIFDLILLDLTLPESQGLNTFYQVHARVDGIPIVVLSGTDDELTAVEAVRGGAQDYLVKGHADHQLIIRSIRYALERKRAEMSLRQREEHFRSLLENARDLISSLDQNLRFTYISPSHQPTLNYSPEELLGRNLIDFLHPDEMTMVMDIVKQCLENENYSKAIEFRLRDKKGSWCILEGFFNGLIDPENNNVVVINSHDITERFNHARELQMAYEATLEGWSRALELRDKETQGHSNRVTEMTLTLAKAMGVDDEELINIHRGTLLHDIGKMAIPDRILRKKGKLTEDEWDIMRQHPTYAYDMLYPIVYLRPSLDIPYCHHEKWDGSGYPRGLERKDIPLAARIFAVVDVWDALLSERPYSPAWTEKEARNYIIEQSGKHFDPDIVDVFLDLI